MSRYIDADLIEYEPMCRARGNGMYEDCEIAYRDEIDDIPTADVRENVMGRWVEVVDRTEMYDKEGVKTWGMLFQCNQCGFVLNAVEGHTGQYNYCPNCGADMRGDNHD